MSSWIFSNNIISMQAFIYPGLKGTTISYAIDFSLNCMLFRYVHFSFTNSKEIILLEISNELSHCKYLDLE